MQLVAVLGTGPSTRALARFRDPEHRVWLQLVPNGATAAAVRALPVLGFAGALVFGDEARREAARTVARSSLDAEELAAVDAVTVAGDTTLGDLVGARALVDGLRTAGWEPRGARVVALGDGNGLRPVLRELAAAGADEVTAVASDAPTAEQALPPLPSGVAGRGLAARDPAVATVLERCDAVVRTADVIPAPLEHLGPHLTVVDLVPGLAPDWRTAGRAAGATTVAWADVEAYRVAAALRTVVGGAVDPGPLLELFHGA
jgi:shikimate 5-dehydrogenase